MFVVRSDLSLAGVYELRAVPTLSSVSGITKGDDSYQMFICQITSEPCFEIQHRNYFDFKISREFFLVIDKFSGSVVSQCT